MIQSTFFNVPIATKLFIYIINDRTFLVLSNFSNKRYFCLPKFIVLFKKEHKFHFKSEITKQALFSKFIEKFRAWFSERLIRKKIMLKGLGYKATFLDNKKILNLKIGFSHPIKVLIKSEKMLLKINKGTITIKGFVATEIGNFAEKIRKLKVPDSYKGKGIFYKNEKKNLKLVKKR